MSQALEAQRTDFAKQLARWKQKIGSTQADAFPFGPHTALIAELREQVKLLQRELGTERLRRGANPSPNRGWSPSTRRTVNDSTSWRGGTSSRPSSASRAQSAEARRSSSASRPWTAHDTSASRWSGIAGRGSTPPVPPRSASAPRSREVSPALRQRRSHADYGTTSGRRSSPALASTLGGRFDPTAYQQDRTQRVQQALHNRAWGAGAAGTPTATHRHRYQSPHGLDSGYTSANSQVRNGAYVCLGSTAYHAS
jgi:hypothetical protein